MASWLVAKLPGGEMTGNRSLYMFPARSEIWSYLSGYFDRFSSASYLYNAVSEGHAQKNLQLDKIAQMEYAINNCEL